MTAAAWTISTHLLSFNSEFMTLNIWRHTVAAGCVTVWVLILWYIWTVFFLWNHFIVLFIIIKSLCLIAAVWTLSPEVLLLLCVCVCVCARACVCVCSHCVWVGQVPGVRQPAAQVIVSTSPEHDTNRKWDENKVIHQKKKSIWKSCDSGDYFCLKSEYGCDVFSPADCDHSRHLIF